MILSHYRGLRITFRIVSWGTFWFPPLDYSEHFSQIKFFCLNLVKYVKFSGMHFCTSVLSYLKLDLIRTESFPARMNIRIYYNLYEDVPEKECNLIF